jgi:hypothetical protein
MGIIIGGNTISGNFNSLGDSQNAPNIVTDSLQFWLDPGNNSSYLNTSNYYDCGYGCQYYSSAPACTNCSTQIKDISGNGYDGTFQNGAAISYSSGGGAMTFNTASQYVSCGSLGSMYSYGTICLWINASAMSNYNNCFSTHYLGSNVGFRFEENASGNFGVVIGNDAGTYTGNQFIASGMATNTWYHIVVTWTTPGSNAIGYLNGAQVFNNSAPYFATTLPSISIGSGFSASRYWAGSIGPVMIYNKALNATEVLQNFNNGRQRFGI